MFLGSVTRLFMSFIHCGGFWKLRTKLRLFLLPSLSILLNSCNYCSADVIHCSELPSRINVL